MPWEIELRFKESKSQYALDAFRTTDANLVGALIWATLLTLVASRRIYNLVRARAPASVHAEDVVDSSSGRGAARFWDACSPLSATRSPRRRSAASSTTADSLRAHFAHPSNAGPRGLVEVRLANLCPMVNQYTGGSVT